MPVLAYQVDNDPVPSTFVSQNQEPTQDPKNEEVIEVLPWAFEEEPTEEPKNEEDIEVISDAFEEGFNINLVCNPTVVTTIEANETPETNENIPEMLEKLVWAMDCIREE